jgi:hypothetical protein
MRPLVVLAIVILVILNVGVPVQAYLLQRIFQSTAWTKLASGFVVLGVRFFWNLAVVTGAPARFGVVWWINVVVGCVAYILFAMAFHDLRRQLHRIGVRGKEFS